MSVTKVATSATVIAGGEVGWTLTVHNDGPATARDVGSPTRCRPP